MTHRTKESGTFAEQHEKNMRILKLIRDEPAWALSRILLAETLEAAAEVAARDDCGPKTTKRILRAALGRPE